MDGTDDGQTQIDAREKAAALLKDRHDRESEALAALMAALSRRASALDVVKRETEQIESRLDQMTRFGFDDAALAELGIDIAGIRQGPTTEEEPATETPADVDLNAEEEANAQADPTGDHAGAVRTTAHLTGSVLHRAGASRQ